MYDLYIACLVMIWMYFFNRLDSLHFNYWCSVLVGITVLLRDILFAPPLAFYAIHLACLVLAVLLLCTLIYFYARKNWKSYTKRNLWTIWIRPTITYGLVACFVTEREIQ